jgi:hypothetical protein
LKYILCFKKESKILFWEVLGSNMKNFDENSDTKISEYFDERLLKLFDSIFDEKTNNYSKKYSIVLIGYSLVGIIAQVFMYFSITKNNILNIQNNKPMAITYFQIKPGNK